MSLRTDVLNLLQSFRPLNPEEHLFRGRMLQLAGVDGDPFSRTHFQPGHFTASAFVVSPDAKSVLLIHHTKLGRWLQPGGHVEPDDPSLLAAALREVLEETGIVPAAVEPHVFDLDIHPIPARREEPAHQHFDLRFLCRASSTSVDANSEVMDARWFTLDDAIVQSADESVKRVIAKLRAAK